MKKRLIMAVMAAGLMAGAAHASNITFDDVTDYGGGTQISNGYAGLNWNNFYVVNTASYTAGEGPNGYANATVSAPNVAYDAYGAPASFSSASTFTLKDLYLGAAWNDGLSVTITGLLNGNTVDSVTEVVNTSGASHEVLNWTGINEVEFSPSGGTNHGYNGSGEHFVLDNLAINGPVPEPATWAMLILGVGMIGIAARRRNAGLALAA